MAVPIKEGAGVEAGLPISLFATIVPYSGLTDLRNNYAVTHDGQKFIVNTLDGASAKKRLPCLGLIVTSSHLSIDCEAALAFILLDIRHDPFGTCFLEFRTKG
jgi:hypothetical protein